MMLRAIECPTDRSPIRIASWLIASALAMAGPGTSLGVEPSTDHDFVIVGTGAAGLYAAFELDALGYDVLILEATDRHGGRVYSATNANGTHTRVLPDLISVPEPTGFLVLGAGVIGLMWHDAGRRDRRSQRHLITCRVCKYD